jgi:pimeloyl-ACP methyl ester carboxylesterase
MPHARINGIDIYFERHGEAGEPLVLIHGYTGDISDWRFQIEAFAPTNRVLVFDNRGHGLSEAPPDRASYTISQMAFGRGGAGDRGWFRALSSRRALDGRRDRTGDRAG